MFKYILFILSLIISVSASAVIIQTPAKVKVSKPLIGSGLSGDPVRAVVNVPGGFAVLDSSGAIPQEIISSTTIKQPMAIYGTNLTLGVGTTFYAFTPAYDIELTGLTTTILVQGSEGASTWRCGDQDNSLFTVTYSTQTSGMRTSAAGTIDINKNTEVVCLMIETTQVETPTAAVVLQYSAR